MDRKTPSNRSRKPPCPGKIFPESLTPTLRLNMDSTKSPKVPIVVTIKAIISQSNILKSINIFEIIIDTIKAKNIPPNNPSHDFFGEILLNNLCFPKGIPIIYAPVS